MTTTKSTWRAIGFPQALVELDAVGDLLHVPVGERPPESELGR
jgi:hypothetical protein